MQEFKAVPTFVDTELTPITIVTVVTDVTDVTSDAKRQDLRPEA